MACYGGVAMGHDVPEGLRKTVLGIHHEILDEVIHPARAITRVPGPPD